LRILAAPRSRGTALPDHARYYDQVTGDLGFGPRVPHAPPYDSEISEGIAAAGFKTGTVYNREEFSRGAAIMFMQIPNEDSPVGKTPDYDSGPALSLDTYPYMVTITVLFEGEPIIADTLISEPFPATAGTLIYEDGSPITFAGLLESHLSTNRTLSAPLEIPNEIVVGDYEYRVRSLDVNGNGWEFTAPFSVVPEPKALALLILAAPRLGVMRSRAPSQPRLRPRTRATNPN
jgi:hypothetical protein